MNTEFIQTLMANNDKAREHALKLNEEVSRLRQRENELTQKVLQLLATKDQPTEEEKAFVEWLLQFRLEADEPQKNKKQAATSSSSAEKAKEDARGAAYVAVTDDTAPQEAERIAKIREELKLLSRVKRRDKFPWIEARQTPTEAEVYGWETHKGVKLPPGVKEMYKIVGANTEWRKLDADQAHIHRYSPLLALLPLDEVGWTEVWGQDHEPEEGYDDDNEAARVLKAFDAGHEFDDSFICEQLCGKDRNVEDPVRVLLVGAPINLKVMHNGKAGIVNSRMFLNIRPSKEPGKFLGDGMLYRLDCSHSQNEEGDSELIRIGTAYDWLEKCVVGEVEDRLAVAGEKDPLVQRYPSVIERSKKKQKIMTPEEADSNPA